ncbi:MAG: hypothetical protein AB8F26_10290 [Phycisphaerales bacterium]
MRSVIFIAALGLSVISLSIAGCNVITPVAYAIHGPEKVQAHYEPDPDRTTVIFVDDPSSQLAQRRLRYQIADEASRILMGKEVILDMLDSRPILNAATKERYGQRTSITELGQGVGADIVIYAVVTDFSISPKDGTFVPVANMRVKVIDTATGERLWPESEAGYLLDVRIQQRSGLANDLNNGQLAVQSELASRAALGLSQMFYKHELPDTVLNGR